MALESFLYLFPSNFDHPGLKHKVSGQLDALKLRFKPSFYHPHFFRSDHQLIKGLKLAFFELRALFLIWRYDIIYVRYVPKAFLINGIVLLGSLFKPVYIEHNLIFNKELGLLNRPIEQLMDQIFLFLFRFFSITHIAVTKEIQSYLQGRGYQSVQFAQNCCYVSQKSSDNIDDAIIYQVKDFIDPKKKVGIFIGNGYKWHGLDKIIQVFKDRCDYQIIVIGPYCPDESLSHFLFLGRMSHYTVQSIYNLVDFGIGTFNYESLSIVEGCPLKIREYLSFGLPILVNYEESAASIPELQPYIFDYRNGDQIVDQLLQASFDKDKIRKIALTFLTWKKILLPIIDKEFI